MENALGGPIDRTLTIENIRQIVAEFSDESEFAGLKHKGAMLGERNNRDRWRVERSKDVAAFANARGGLMILGVRDAKADASAGQLEPFATAEADPAALIEDNRKAVREVTAPVPGFGIFPVHDPDNGTFYIVCVVPPSAIAPHAVKQPGDAPGSTFGSIDRPGCFSQPRRTLDRHRHRWRCRRLSNPFRHRSSRHAVRHHDGPQTMPRNVASRR
jgi:hypothetical protein